MSEFDEIPFPEYESDPETIALLYIAMWSQVLEQVDLLSQLPQSSNTTFLLSTQMGILREITRIFDTFNRNMSSQIEDLLHDAYYSGPSYSAYALGKYESQGDARVVFESTAMNDRKIRKMITDTQRDLLKATKNTEENVKKLVRTSVATAMRSTGGRNVKVSNMADKIKDALTKERLRQGLEESNVAIIDKANRRWKLDTYINMVAKTKMNTAYMDGIRDEAERDGADLGIISTKPGTSDACLNFEGMIISLNGKTEGLPSYESLKRSKLVFHPNCGHFVRPVASWDMIPQKHLETHEKKISRYGRYLEGQSA